MNSISNLNILAEGDAVVTSEPIDTAAEGVPETFSDGSPVEVNDPNSAGGQQQGFNPQMIFLILMVVVIYFFIFRGPKKQRCNRNKNCRRYRKIKALNETFNLER